MSMGQKLMRFRTSKGLSIQYVAKAIGVPISTYRDWEYGKQIRGEPYVKIAELFEITLDELLRAEPPRKSELTSLLENIQSEVNQALNLARSF